MNQIKVALISVVLAALLPSTIMLNSLEAEATQGQFKIRVYATGVDSLTGKLYVTATAANGETQTMTSNPSFYGYAGTVLLTVFTIDASSTKTNELFDVCIKSARYPNLENCIVGENTPKKAPEDFYIEAPSGIGRSPNDPKFYN